MRARGRAALLLGALRRFLVLLGIAAAVTLAGSLFLALLTGVAVERAVSLGFYGVGSFLLVAGFFVGNRGPMRTRSEPAGGPKKVRLAGPSEREDALNTSAVFVAIGLALLVLGVVTDSRFELY